MTSRTARPSKTVPRPGDTPGAGRARDWRKDSNWLAAVGSLDKCVRCGRWGIQVAHRDEGKGMAQKAPDCLTAALCPECHHELGNGKTLTREQRRAEMDHAIVLTLAALAEQGKVRAE